MLWFYNWFFPAVWFAFMVYWQIKASHTKTTERLESGVSRVTRAAVFLAAIVLLSVPQLPGPFLYRSFLHQGLEPFYTGATITVAGLLFAVWAREHLGANWSRSVTIKKDHELITSGPYAVVRHPIYTGILAGFLGTVIAEGQVRSLIALALVSVALWYKLRMEERWMKAYFGASYNAYSHRVAALVPYLL
jgi:protein-S-isoprenylcysteine O-methyltransferase Ste14